VWHVAELYVQYGGLRVGDYCPSTKKPTGTIHLMQYKRDCDIATACVYVAVGGDGRVEKDWHEQHLLKVGLTLQALAACVVADPTGIIIIIMLQGPLQTQ
jgi:hypothetical protein